jgi:O-antigen biosynthesis protein
MTTESQVLIVAGMHRSGTSLATNWLSQCGLYVGDSHVPPDRSNPFGHYEDLEFTALNRSILFDNNLDHMVTKGNRITVSEKRLEEARLLIQRKRKAGPWGWKDPRTTLLLEMWDSLLPEARYLLMFRSPDLVVDSLLRRDFLTATWRSKYRLGSKMQKYYRVWERYNSDICSFYDKNPERVLLFEVGDLLMYDDRVIRVLSTVWGLTLNYVPIYSVFQEDALSMNIGTYARQSHYKHPVTTMAIFRELVSRNKASINRLVFECEK